MTIEYEKSIPIPTPKKRYKHDFTEMEVGDSFVGGVSEANGLHMWCKRHGWTFTRRRIEGETPNEVVWRFWRVT
jgi:hypothetical protein